MFCYSTQADFIPLTIHYFFFSYSDRTNRLHKYQYTIKRGETVPQCWWQSITAINGTEQRRSWRRHINYGSPPWNTGATFRFLSLCRDFLQDCWWSKVALKLKSSTIRCCWDAGGGLPISKRLFKGLRINVRFFDFPEETRRLLGPGEIKEGTRTGTYSTRPSSTIFETRQ